MECFALGVRWVLSLSLQISKCEVTLTMDYTFVINFPSATRAFKMGLFDTPKIGSLVTNLHKFKHILSVVIQKNAKLYERQKL